ncbi:hypothetical protein [Streptomyces sp. NPDC021096]
MISQFGNVPINRRVPNALAERPSLRTALAVLAAPANACAGVL